MEIQFREVEGNQQEGFFATVGAIAVGRGNFRLHVAPGLIQGFSEQCDILTRALNVVKRRFGLIAHGHALPTATGTGGSKY